jgi:heat shock protein HtpX
VFVGARYVPGEEVIVVMNRVKTAMLLAALTALVVLVGQAVAGQAGLVLALAFAGVMNFGAYWFSDKIVLRMHGAREVGPAEAPELHATVRGLAEAAGLPMPKVYVMAEDAPNAFATGRNPSHAAVAVTEGLLRLLDRDETRGVLAHELAHVKNRDTLISTVSAAFAGAMSALAQMALFNSLLGGSSDDEEGGGAGGGLLAIFVAPIAASLIQLAVSRSREYAADETGARIAGDPIALARALRKIEAWSARVPIRAGAPATAHMFIVNPFSAGGAAKLFSTHPSTEDRVRRLEGMAGRVAPARLVYS